MTVEKPPIVFIGAAAGNYQKGRPSGVYAEGLVVHTTGGGSTIESLDSWFKNPQAGVSTQFGIGPDSRGNVVCHQYVSLDDIAYGQGLVNKPTSQLVLDNGTLNPNTYLIGCEMVDGGKAGNHSPAMRDLLAWVYSWVWESYLLPHGGDTGVSVPDRYRVIGHYQIDSVNRPFCPSWSEAWYTELIEGMKKRLSPSAETAQQTIDRLRASLRITADGMDDRATDIEGVALLLRQQAQSARTEADR